VRKNEKSFTDMMLGRKTRCSYRKNPVKTAVVSANIPAGTATKVPILGQYGVQ